MKKTCEKLKQGMWNMTKRYFTKSHDSISNVVRSGDYCKCGACGYEGYAYGIAHAKGVSAPFCQNCGINSKLSVIDK